MAAPKLRFEKYNEVWNSYKLIDIAKIYDGTHQTPNYVEQGVPFYSVEHVTANDFSNTKFIAEEVYQSELKRVSLQKGDILMTRIGDIGTSRLIDWDVRASFYVSLALIKVTGKNSSVFINQYIKSRQFQKELHDRTIHVAFPKKINLGEIGLCKIQLPEIEEQTKIASFLSAVDEKISQLTQKQQLLSQYKQGMMQKLFSQQIRFKADDGSEFGEWEEKALKTIARIYDGTHQTPNYVEDGVPFYSVEHVTANNFSKTKFIAENVFLDELKRVQLEKNDILLTRIGDIGTSKLIDWDVRASFYVSLALIKVDKNHNSSFVNQYIKSIFFQKELHERTIHVAFPKKINLGEIGLCLIRLPCLAEQTKIANFLSAIDQKIEVVAQQIEQAKTWKKGLLQQMFV